MQEERNNMLAKLHIELKGDMNKLSNVLSVVLSNIYKQLEQAIQERTEAEVEKRILEEKLQNLISKDKK